MSDGDLHLYSLRCSSFEEEGERKRTVVRIKQDGSTVPVAGYGSMVWEGVWYWEDNENGKRRNGKEAKGKNRSLVTERKDTKKKT